MEEHSPVSMASTTLSSSMNKRQKIDSTTDMTDHIYYILESKPVRARSRIGIIDGEWSHIMSLSLNEFETTDKGAQFTETGLIHLDQMHSQSELLLLKSFYIYFHFADNYCDSPPRFFITESDAHAYFWEAVKCQRAQILHNMHSDKIVIGGNILQINSTIYAIDEDTNRLNYPDKGDRSFVQECRGFNSHGHCSFSFEMHGDDEDYIPLEE
jgi:hypothetical protein